MMNATSILSIKKLSKRYQAEQVLDGVDFEAKTGEVIVLFGKSGSGKSTCLKCINQLELPDAGEISLLGQRCIFTEKQKPTKQQTMQLRRNIGMVFQNFYLWPHLTVLENLILAPLKVLKLSKAIATTSALNLLDKLGLLHKENSYPATLSGGQQQRVSIARSLLMSPKLMLFDEPTSALDPEMVHEILQLIIKLKSQGMTMIIATHEINFAKKIADKILFLAGGKIVEEGSSDIIEKPKTNELKQFLQVMGI